MKGWSGGGPLDSGVLSASFMLIKYALPLIQSFIPIPRVVLLAIDISKTGNHISPTFLLLKSRSRKTAFFFNKNRFQNSFSLFFP